MVDVRVSERVLARDEDVMDLAVEHLVLPVFELRSHWVRMGRLALHLDRYGHAGRLTDMLLRKGSAFERPGDLLRCVEDGSGTRELIFLFLGARGELGHRRLGKAFRRLGRALTDVGAVRVAIETPAGGWSDPIPLIPAFIRASESLAMGLDVERAASPPAQIDFLVTEGDAPFLAGLAAAPWKESAQVADDLSPVEDEPLPSPRRHSTPRLSPYRPGAIAGTARLLMGRGPFAVLHGDVLPRDTAFWCLQARGATGLGEPFCSETMGRALAEVLRDGSVESRWVFTSEEACLLSPLPSLVEVDNETLGLRCREAARAVAQGKAHQLALRTVRGPGDVHAIVRNLLEGLEALDEGIVPDLAFLEGQERCARDLAYAVGSLPFEWVERWEALRRRRAADGAVGRKRLAHVLDYEVPTPLARLWRGCRSRGGEGSEVLVTGLLAFHRALLSAALGLDALGSSAVSPRLSEAVELLDELAKRAGAATSTLLRDFHGLWDDRRPAAWRSRLEGEVLRASGVPIPEGELDGFEGLMAPMAYLAPYALFHVVDAVDAGTAWMHTVELLRGWGGLFEKEEFVCECPLEAGSCHLVDPEQREILPLDPWMRFEACPACGGRHAFLFDHVEGDEIVYRAPDAATGCELRRSESVWREALARGRPGVQALTVAGEGRLDMAGADWYLPVGAVVEGRFEVVGALKRGGMAEVYRAFDRELGVDHALKVMSASLLESRSAEDRFRREAALLARLRHGNVVAVSGYGRVGGRSYLLLEYVDGEDLRERMNLRGPCSPVELIDLAAEILEALVYLHEVPGGPVVHRDLKPENVLIASDGQVKLADFGLARSPDQTRLTGSGVALGTLRYMAPEQSRGEVDPRSDLYSLGVILFEWLVGRLPMPVEDGRRSLEAEGAAPELAALIMDLLALRPEDRPATAREALARLRSLPTGTKVSAIVVDPIPAVPGAETLLRHVAEVEHPGLFEGLERFYHSSLKPRALYLLDVLESAPREGPQGEEGSRCRLYLDELRRHLNALAQLPQIDRPEGRALVAPARRLLERLGDGNAPGCREAARRLVDLTDLCLCAFRAVARAFRLSAILRDGATMMAPAVDRGEIRITFDLPEDEPSPRFLCPFLRRSLVEGVYELLENARKAMAHQDERDCLLRLRWDPDEEKASIEVIDCGSGLDPTLGERIFEAGVSTFGSSGLGLADLRRGMRAFGFSLRFGPGPEGRGARFSLELTRSALEGGAS